MRKYFHLKLNDFLFLLKQVELYAKLCAIRKSFKTKKIKLFLLFYITFWKLFIYGNFPKKHPSVY